MTFTPKDWIDSPSTATPISAGALEDMETRLAAYTDSSSVAKADLPVNVMDYGAIGNGVTDDTVAFQAAIDACIGPGLPATVTRTALRSLYIPTGTYKLSDTLEIRSVLGLKVFGDGYYSRLMPATSVALTTLLDLDGLAMCSFSDFRIEAEAPTSGTMDNVIHLRWSTAANRSTTAVTFYRVHIANTKFKRGFAIEQDDGTRQNDECLYEDCRIVGQWTAGEGTWWQYGMRFGNGTAGNVLNHHIVKGNISSCAIGAEWSGSSGGMWAGGCQANGTDFSGQGGPINRFVHIQDVRSEGSERLWVTPVSGAKATVELSNIDWHGNAMHADALFVQHFHGGSFRMTNVGVFTANAAPKIYCHCNVGDPTNFPNLVTKLDGVVARTAPGSFLHDTTIGAQVTVRNYTETDLFDNPVQTYAEYGVHAIPSIVAAATVTLLPLVALTKMVEITGNTGITSVTAGYPGQLVLLKFTGTPTVTDGSNLKLAGNFVAAGTTADADMLTLVCDGTNWWEVARSVN